MSAEARAVADAALAADFLTRYPAEAAARLEEASPRSIAELLTALPTAVAASVLERLPSSVAADAVRELDPAARGELLAAADLLRVASLLARLDDEERAQVIGELDPGVAAEVEGLLSYPAGTAGALMDPRVPMMAAGRSAADALEWLRTRSDRRILGLYLIDAEGVFVGRVALQELAVAAPEARLQELVDEPPVSVQATASQEEVVELLEAHRFLALPVVDFAGRLVGFIRNTALLDAVEREATADIQSMVGASRNERALSPVGFAVRKRLPWLEVNLLTAFLAAAVVGLFEGTIARFTALAVLLPVVAGQSGNTGAQALAVTMRGLALREVRVRQWLRVAGKEAAVAFVNGLAVAASTAAAVYVWSRSPGLTLVIGVSMVLSMVAAGLSGAAIPMLLTALRQDPAQSSSIILTTVTDIVGFFSFLGIATLLAGTL